MVRLYRTFSNYTFTGEKSVQGGRPLVQGGSSASNLLKPSRTTSAQFNSVAGYIVRMYLAPTHQKCHAWTLKGGQLKCNVNNAVVLVFALIRNMPRRPGSTVGLL